MRKKLVPQTGFSPDLIGEVVVVQMFRKKVGDILNDTLEKHVGVLDGYYLSAKNGGSFSIKGYSPIQFTTRQSYLEIYAVEEPTG